MQTIFSKIVFIFFISLSLFETSCSNESILGEYSSTQPNAIIKDLKLTPLLSTRSTNISGEDNLVSFTDDATGEEYEYILRQESKDNYTAIFDPEGESIKLSMKVHQINEHEWVVEHECDSLYKAVKITTTSQANGNTLISLDHNVPNTRSYWVRESWLDCVTRLSLGTEAGMLSMFMRSYVPCIAGAAAVVCLDNRSRKHTFIKNNDPGSITAL